MAHTIIGSFKKLKVSNKAYTFLLILFIILLLSSCSRKRTLMIDTLEWQSHSGEVVTLQKGDKVTVTDRIKIAGEWLVRVDYNGVSGSNQWLREGYFKKAGQFAKVYNTALVNVPYGLAVSDGPHVSLNEGDELIILKTFNQWNDTINGQKQYCEVLYKGKKGFIEREYVDWQDKKVNIYGVEPSRSTNIHRTLVLGNMPFGNATILVIGLFILSFVVLLVGRVLSFIPLIGKFIFLLIGLAVIGIWFILIRDLIITGGILELFVVGILLIIGCIIPGPKIWWVFIFEKK